MKTLINKLITCCIISVSALSSCSREEALPQGSIIGLGGDSWEETAIDQYLNKNFTRPYNIEVKYKWDPYEVNFNRALVPPKESHVIPVMETVKAIWMDPYEKSGGEYFLKKYQILKYVLVGSAEYQDNGTIILGTAEGGNKITLFVVNSFNKKNRGEVIRMMHTIHHEFAHILHQTKSIPEGWRGISDEWYTGTWFNTTDADANKQGMVTAYAKSSIQEDFVETISFLLVEGQAAYDAIIVSNPDQAKILRKKEELVVAYYKSLGIDFKQLQALIKQGVDQITN